MSTGQGVLGNNMFAYCGNNPVNRADKSGKSWSDLWEFVKNVAEAIENVMNAWSPAYSYCGQLAELDGPAPYLDVAAAAGSILLTIGAVGVAGYQTLTSPAPSLSVPKVETKEKEVTLNPPPSSTAIYRYNGTNPGNLVPSKFDVASNSGLSFSTIPQPNSWRTTIEQVNSTGVLLAVQDKPTHVTVYPIGGTVSEWRNLGSSSIWTITLMSVSTKVKWDRGK